MQYIKCMHSVVQKGFKHRSSLISHIKNSTLCMYAYSAYCLVPDLSNKTHFCFTVNFKWIFLCTCYRFLWVFFMFTISLPVTSFYLVSTKNLYNLYKDEQISTYLQHKMPPWISLYIMSAVLHVLGDGLQHAHFFWTCCYKLAVNKSIHLASSRKERLQTI